MNEANDPGNAHLTNGFSEELASLSNADLLGALDLILLELERRLLRYAQLGAEILEMADEGLVLAMRSSARLVQAQSAAGQHPESPPTRRGR